MTASRSVPTPAELFPRRDSIAPVVDIPVQRTESAPASRSTSQRKDRRPQTVVQAPIPVTLPSAVENVAAARRVLDQLKAVPADELTAAAREPRPALRGWVIEVLTKLLGDKPADDPRSLSDRAAKQLFDATAFAERFLKARAERNALAARRAAYLKREAAERAEREAKEAKAKQAAAAESAQREALATRVAELRSNVYMFGLLERWIQRSLIGDLSRHSVERLDEIIVRAERVYRRYDREAESAAQPTRRPGAPKRRGNAAARQRKSDVNAAIIAARTGKTPKKN